MFDFTNLVLNNKKTAEGLLNNPQLSFSTKISSTTGRQVDGIHEAEYANMTFIVYPGGRILIKGSLHKLHSFLTINKEWNYDTFSYNQVAHTLSYLKEVFDIDPEETRIHGIEFGFNLKPKDFEASFKSFVAYRSSRWNKMHAETPIRGWEVNNSLHKIKVYDKGLNFNLPYPILRYEFKAIKMRAIESSFPYGLTLNELLDPNTWSKCKDTIITSLTNCIISDSINTSKLSVADRKVFITGNNPREWEELNKRNLYHFKKRYNSIIEKCGKLRVKEELSTLMDQEYIKMQVPSEINIGLFHPAIKKEHWTISPTVRGEKVQSPILKDPSHHFNLKSITI